MNEPQAFPPDSATAGDGGAAARHCPECHCKMPGDSPFGVCPRCLLCSVLPASETWPDDLDPGFLDPIERPGILGLLDGYIGNAEQLWTFAWFAQQLLHKWLTPRSQRRSYTWTSFGAAWERWKMPSPRIVEEPWPFARQARPRTR